MSNNTGIKRKNRRTVVNRGMIRKENVGEYYIQTLKQEKENQFMGQHYKK